MSGMTTNPLRFGQESLDLSVLLARAQNCHIIPTMPFYLHQHFLVVLRQGVISYHIIESNRGGRQGDIGRCIGC